MGLPMASAATIFMSPPLAVASSFSAAATAAGYNYLDYTHEVVVTASKPVVSFGGIAFVGARGAWLANSQWNVGVCSHEVGHNFGLNHSGFWDTDDGTTIGSGTAVEYGNPFDHMGGASSSFNAHSGARLLTVRYPCKGRVIKSAPFGAPCGPCLAALPGEICRAL